MILIAIYLEIIDIYDPLNAKCVPINCFPSG